MRTLRVATFVSMDGVMQAPGGPEEDAADGFAYGGWTVSFWDEALGQLMDEAMGQQYDLLLGRRTYQIFAGFWPNADDELARVFNSVNKYVAAAPGTPMTWAGSHRLEGDLIEAVRTLKATEGRNLLVQGSSEVIHALLAANLVDQLTLLTFPVILGRGKRLFDNGSSPRAWTLLSSKQSTTGVLVSTYALAGEIPIGSFVDEVRDPDLARQAAQTD